VYSTESHIPAAPTVLCVTDGSWRLAKASAHARIYERWTLRPRSPICDIMVSIDAMHVITHLPTRRDGRLSWSSSLSQ